VNVVPINEESAEPEAPAPTEMEAEPVVPSQLTPEQQQALLDQLIREQQLNKRTQKQRKYKHLISSAF
jgi:hypothetical protein